MKRDIPENYWNMAKMEHTLTDLKGHQVTMLKDQSNEAKAKLKVNKKDRSVLVFLEPHPDYPENKTIADFPPMKVEPLIDCNGYCGTRELDPKIKEFQQQINFEIEE
jgi:hypothetical protein